MAGKILPLWCCNEVDFSGQTFQSEAISKEAIDIREAGYRFMKRHSKINTQIDRIDNH